MEKGLFSNMLFLLLWLCSELGMLYFDSGLELGLELFVVAAVVTCN